MTNEDIYWNRHKVEVHLALSAVNSQEPHKSVFALWDDPISLPHVDLWKSTTSFREAQALFRRMTGSDPNPWVPMRQVGVFEQIIDGIVILYACMIPEPVPFLDTRSRWCDFAKMREDQDVASLMGYACNFYKIGGVA